MHHDSLITYKETGHHPTYSVWDENRFFLGYTNRKGVIQYDESCQKLNEEKPLMKLVTGYLEFHPTENFVIHL
jgi:hypothetical protein